jgi:hypothetical protein
MNRVIIDILREKINTDTLFFIKTKSGLIYTAKLIDIQEDENKILILDKFSKISLLDFSSIEQISEQSGNSEEYSTMKEQGMNYK